jgi:alanine racemase
VLHKDSVFDMIRPGIAVYGYFSPDLNIKLEPVMEIESELTLIKVFPAGHSIGYGRTYKVNRKERIGIVPLGYGDGLIRGLSNKLTPIINGKKAQSVGRISMDQFAVRVQNNAKVGDKVYIIGGNKNVKNTAADMAEQCGTISYEILCDIGNSKRVSHEYIY